MSICMCRIKSGAMRAKSGQNYITYGVHERGMNSVKRATIQIPNYKVMLCTWVKLWVQNCELIRSSRGCITFVQAVHAWGNNSLNRCMNKVIKFHPSSSWLHFLHPTTCKGRIARANKCATSTIKFAPRQRPDPQIPRVQYIHWWWEHQNTPTKGECKLATLAPSLLRPLPLAAAPLTSSSTRSLTFKNIKSAWPKQNQLVRLHEPSRLVDCESDSLQRV